MPDRDDQLLELDDPYEDDWEPVDDDGDDSPPPRRKRRIVTPLSAALVGVLIGALGFIGGVKVQKHQDSSGGGTSEAPTGFAAARSAGGGTGAAGGFPGRGGGAGGGGRSNATIGSVANKHGSTLYVKDSDGNVIRVKTTSNSKVNRTASTTAGAIHPGDTVIVQGTKHSNGTVTATQINATASGVSGGLASLFGGGGGGFPGGGGGGGQGAAPQGSGSQGPSVQSSGG